MKKKYYICHNKITKKITDKNIRRKMDKILEFNGNTDDLLSLSPDGTMKCANFVYLGDDPMDEESEVFHCAITSTSMNGEHEVFDKMLGKEVKVTVTII